MISVCPNPFRDIDYKITLEICAILNREGYETVICPVFGDGTENPAPPGVKVYPLEKIAETDLAVVVGGDGTILAVCRKIWEYDVPVMGVNLGTMGFMASIERDELEKVLIAAQGKAGYSRRTMLDVKLVRNGEVVFSDTALNDAVVHGAGDCIKIKAQVDGSNITAFSGDGIVVSTPTGSTGYSLSAGGPIVEPEAENFIITPICAHVYGSRSFVLSANRTVTVEAHKGHDRNAYLSVDGNKLGDVLNGDTLVITKSEKHTTMIIISPKSFFDIAYEKLT